MKKDISLDNCFWRGWIKVW